MKYTTCPWFRACDRRSQGEDPKGQVIAGPCGACVEGRAGWRLEAAGGSGCAFNTLLGSDLWKTPLLGREARPNRSV